MTTLMETPANRSAHASHTSELPRCASQGCGNLVHEAWEETGTLCGRCAIGNELFDRDSRRENVFPSRV